MTGQAFPLVLALVGLYGQYLIGQKVTTGWFVALWTQVLWFAFAIITQQYGFILTAVAYGVMAARNIREWNQKEQNDGA